MKRSSAIHGLGAAPGSDGADEGSTPPTRVRETLADMVWIAGAKGLLGGYVRGLLERLGFRFVATDREVDIADREALAAFAGDRPIKLIINCAGFTNVRACETAEKEAFRANADGVRELARVAAAKGARLIHLSTDYVFDGAAGRPYAEGDPPNPLNAYGRSKLAGEQYLAASQSKWTIVRTSWLYGAGGYNFVSTVLSRLSANGSMRVVDDQFGTPTYAADLAEAILELAEAEPGIYHFANSGTTSWFEFAEEIARFASELGLFEARPRIEAVSSAEYKDSVVRPPFSALATEKAAVALGRPPRPWQEALRDFMVESLKELVG